MEYRNYRIQKIIKESATIKSFYLQRADGEAVDNFLPGQFVKINVKPLHGGEELVRNYTLSDRPGKGYFRITVKREDKGIVSTYLHDVLQVGDLMKVSKPTGNFHLTPLSQDTAVFITGGVGITPMLSMLEYIVEAEKEKKVLFLHSSRNKKLQPMAERLRELEACNNKLYLSIHHTQPDDDELLKADYDRKGIISKDYLKSILPIDGVEVFLCGPAPFMETMFRNLLEIGVKAEKISYEFFGEGRLLGDERALIAPNAGQYNVKFTRSGVEAIWDRQQNLLEFAEFHGLSPDNSCRMGTCSTCETSLFKGKVNYDPEPFMEAAEGKIFICCSYPVSDIEIGL